MPAPVTPSTEENPPAAGEHIDEPIPVDQAARAEQQRLQSEAEAAAQALVLFRTGSAIAPASGPLPEGGDLAAARFPAVPPASSVQNDDYAQQNRSAEPTSELQSLMRTSYAVFCLKQKNAGKTEKLLHNNQPT